MERVIFKIIAIVFAIIVLLGVVAPYLVSAKSDFLLVGGFLLTILTFYFGVKFLIKQFKKLKQLTDEKSN